MTLRTSRSLGSGVGVLALGLLLALPACKKGPSGKDVAGMDKELVGNATEADPALTSALQDQIMVDPNLTQQSNDRSARPAGNRRQSPIPPTALTQAGPAVSPLHAGGTLRAPAPTPAAASGRMTLGELAQVQTAHAKAKGCDKRFQYSAAWANRLPAAIPLYPDARVSEAAGNDSAGCRLRIVSFSSAAPMRTLIDWYYTAAIRAGYSSEHQANEGEHILAGAREADDGAYYIFFTERAGGGTDVDLIANNGR